MKKVCTRLLYGLVFLPLASLLLLELVLQAGAYLNLQRHSTPTLPQWLPGNIRIVALGDSNTFGLYLKPEESYPKQLERLWNTQHDKPVDVINLGYPGTNSSRLLSHLDNVIDTFQPDILLVMIGTNDAWTAPITAAENTLADRHSLIGLMKKHSRTYKLYCIVTRKKFDDSMLTGNERLTETLPDGKVLQIPATSGIQYENQTFEFLHQPLPETATDYDSKAALKNNIIQIAQKGKEKGLPVFFMTYAADRHYYRLANKIIRETVTEIQHPYFIDITPVFSDLYPEKGQSNDYFFHDMHATAKGNSIVAQRVMEGMEPSINRNSPTPQK